MPDTGNAAKTVNGIGESSRDLINRFNDSASGFSSSETPL